MEGAARATSIDAWAIPTAGELVAGKYRVVEVIGRGGLAVVFSVIHLELEQKYALKILLPEWANESHVVERFLCEGRAATSIRSENVVRVFDVGRLESGAPYLLMEYLEGSDLETLVSREGPLSIETAVDYVLQATEAIAEAHAVGVIHRDLKPANIFLTHRADASPLIKVLDFGISKVVGRPQLTVTSPSLVLGSPHYMSPEQLRSSHDADERSDIWALGAMLYELLTGSPPFAGESTTELCAQVLQNPAPLLTEVLPDAPPALEATISMCMEKEPDSRFANVGEFALAIAPFGTTSAHASVERILGILKTAGVVTSVRPVANSRISGADALVPAGLRRRRTFGLIATIAVVFAAIGAAAAFYIVRPRTWESTLAPWISGTSATSAPVATAASKSGDVPPPSTNVPAASSEETAPVAPSTSATTPTSAAATPATTTAENATNPSASPASPTEATTAAAANERRRAASAPRATPPRTPRASHPAPAAPRPSTPPVASPQGRESTVTPAPAAAPTNSDELFEERQ